MTSVNGCLNYSVKKIWEIKVYESENEENIFPIKMISDAINNKIYANNARKLLYIDISNESRIWELDAGEDKAIFDFMFNGSDFFVSLIPKQYLKDELFFFEYCKSKYTNRRISLE